MAEKVKDYYAALELDSKATAKEIKNAYRKLAAKYHPDVNKDEEAVEIFQRVKEAYEVLSDSDSRKEYDEFVKTVKDGKDISFMELFSRFHKYRPGAHTGIKGEDVRMKIPFTISEIRMNAEKSVRFERYVNCEDCEGHGVIRTPANTCPDCRGKGHRLVEKRTPFGDIKSEKACGNCSGTGYTAAAKCESCAAKGKKGVHVTVTFKFPEMSATDSDIVTLKGKGDEGYNGGRNGDLILELVQDPDDPYRFVTDYDISSTIDVPFMTALAGGNVKVSLPRGETIKIPVQRGLQSGHQISVPNEGLLNPFNGFYGTLTLQTNILIPSKLPEDKIRKIASILN